MSKKFIVALRNSEPAEPEFEYYCGLSQQARDKSIDGVREDKDRNDILWDTDPDCALKLINLAAAARDAQLLIDVGYDVDLIRIFTAEMVYTQLPHEETEKYMQELAVKSIIDKLTVSDVEYLEDKGLLDLSKYKT
jgi:hypothetical protein